MIVQLTSCTSRVIAASAVAAVLATAGLPALAAGQNALTETVTVSGGWSNDNMAQLATNSGRLLLDRIKAAEDMMDSAQYQAARNELGAAEDTSGAIEKMMPFIAVVDQIKDAKNKLLVEDVEHFREDLLPIYARLDQMSIFAPKVAKDAKDKLKQAENQAVNGKTKEASKAMDAVSESITESTVYLPVDYVYGQVAAARIALSGAKPDVATAKRAVENAEKSLVTVVTTVEDNQKS